MKINELAKKLLLGYREHKEYYSNGQIRLWYWEVNNLLEGEYRTWFNNGKISQHTWYRNGLADGELKHWNHFGELTLQCWYDQGKPKKILENTALKGGHILAGNGKYYKD